MTVGRLAVWLHRVFGGERPTEDGIRARADQQHQWALRGDLRGVYGPAANGRPRPPTPPITPPGADFEVAGVVHTDADLAAMLREKRPCWRYAAFVSVLVIRRAALRARLRDARLGFARTTGEILSGPQQAAEFFADRLADLTALVEQIDSFMLSRAFQEVFGDPHDEGSADAEGIVHVAHRLMDYHDRLLVLSERCRGVTVPVACADLQQDFGLLAALPLEGFGQFVDDFTDRVAEMADVVRFASGDIQLDPVELDVRDDDGLIERVSEQLCRLRQAG